MTDCCSKDIIHKDFKSGFIKNEMIILILKIVEKTIDNKQIPQTNDISSKFYYIKVSKSTQMLLLSLFTINTLVVQKARFYALLKFELMYIKCYYINIFTK